MTNMPFDLAYTDRIVADAAGKDLFIQVTRINDGLESKPPAWHVSVNNPTDQPVTTTLTRAMDVPGLDFTHETVTLAPGECRVLGKPAVEGAKPGQARGREAPHLAQRRVAAAGNK